MIKKRGIVLAASMAVLLFAVTGLMGCSSKENDKSDKKTETREETGKEEKTDAKGDTAEKAAIETGKLEKMLPIFDSVIRFQAQSREPLEYSASDSKYVWGVLNRIITDYARVGDNGVDYTEDSSMKRVPSGVVKEYAQGLFAGIETLPELTADLEQEIGIESVENEYLFALGDQVEMTVSIQDYKEGTDGGWIVNVSSHYPYPASSDTPSAVSSFRIVENPYGGLFPYAVKEVISAAVPENAVSGEEQGEVSGEQENPSDTPETPDSENQESNSGEQEEPEQSGQDSDPADTDSDDDMSIDEYVEKYGEEKALEKYGEVPFNKYYLRPKEAREKMEEEEREKGTEEDSGSAEQNTDETQ